MLDGLARRQNNKDHLRMQKNDELAQGCEHARAYRFAPREIEYTRIYKLAYH